MTEEHHTTDATENEPNKKGKKLLLSLVVTTLVLVGLAIGIPQGLRLYLQSWLVDNGADSAIIDKLRVNPFTGKVALQGVAVNLAGNPVFADSEILVQVSLQDLLQKKAVVKKANLADVILDLERYQDGSLRLGSYSTAAKPTAGPTTADTTSQDSGGEMAWVVLAREITLNKVQVRYRQPGLSLDIMIDQGLARSITTSDEGEPGSLQLAGTINGAPFAFDLAEVRLSPSLSVRGKLDVQALQLDMLAELLGEVLKPFTGKVSLNGQASYAMGNADGMRAGFDGTLQLQEGAVGGAGWQVASGVSWQGKVDFSMNDEQLAVATDGQLTATATHFSMPDLALEVNNGELVLGGQTTVEVSDLVQVNSKNTLSLKQTAFAMAELQAASSTLQWQGALDLATGQFAMTTDGQLTISQPEYRQQHGEGELVVQSNDFNWQGMAAYRTEPSGDQLHTEGQLGAEVLNVSLPEVVKTALGSLTLSGRTELQLGQPLTVDYRGKAEILGSEVNLTDIRLEDEALRWDGEAGYALEELQQLVTLKGELSSEAFTATTPQLQLDNRTLRLTTDGLQLSLAEDVALQGQAEVELNQVSAAQKEERLATLEQLLATGISFRHEEGLQVSRLELGEINIPASSLVPVVASVKNVQLSETSSTDYRNWQSGELGVTGIMVTAPENQQLLAQLDRLTVSNLQAEDSQTIRLDRLHFSQGRFLQAQDKEPLATLTALDFTQVSFQPDSGLTGEELLVSGLKAAYQLESPPESANSSETAAKDSGNPPSPVEQTAAEEVRDNNGPTGVPLRIATIRVEGDSSLSFADRNLSPPFAINLDIEELLAEGLDLTKPEQPFKYQLKGMIDKYSPLEISGTMAPLAAELMVEQQTTLRNYPMLQLSPYLIPNLGAIFPQGDLTLKARLKLAEGRIDADNNLVLRDLETKVVKDSEGKRIGSKLPIPLDLALAMLEDGQGEVDLDVPINGKLADLSVGVADIIFTPVINAISIALTPYLAYTFLGPTGALTYMGATLGQKLLATHLPGLSFTSDQVDLTEAQSKTLESVAKSIATDKDSYLICSRVALHEVAAATGAEPMAILNDEKIRQELFTVGERRAEQVRDYLVKEGKVPEERLLPCNPALNFDQGSTTTVDFRKQQP